MKKSKKKLEKQVQSVLRSKMRIGESRHLAKLNDPNYKPFEKPLDTIHSFKTFDNYLQVSKEFIIYCQNTKGIDKYTHLSELSIYTKDYLKYREDNNYKMSTIKRDRAALGKLFGNSIDYPINAQKFIERSRNDVTRDKNYNAERNKDLISVALGTGLRRHELKSLKASSFFKENERLYLDTIGKGGRHRTLLVLPEYQAEIENIIKTKRNEDYIFKNINTNLDIHSYRREYAKKLYVNVVKDEEIRNDLINRYENRKKYDSAISEHYTTRIGDFFEGRRDDIYLVSQCLGHNRLSDTVKHYLI